tara:strand:+ start:2647 stop:3948 length:1302 start_codon:yes stop_codon:yes gene_type:complete
MSKVNLEITPSNVTSTGKVSFKSGNPVLQFIIGEQDRLLIGSSVRLQGKFSVFAKDGVANAIPQNASSIRMSEQLGIYSVIESVTLKSQATHQVIEEIKSYGRFMASYLPSTSSLNDGLGHFNQTALLKPSYQSQKIGVVDLPTGQTTANSFCIHLPCGLFNGKVPIPLQRNNEGGLGGLLVEIQLAPDSNVLFTNDAAVDIDAAFYELKELSLVAEAQELDPGALPPSNSFEFNSISSYFTTFNSANAIVNFNLGLTRVLGVFGNMVPASHINSRLHNGLACHYPTNADGSIAPIRQLFFTRGGEKFPIEYNINTIQRDAPTNQVQDSQIVRNYLNAIQKFSSIRRTSMTPRNSQLAVSTLAATSVRIEGGSLAGIGCAYDVISGDGVSMSGVNFGINMDVGLTSDSPQALYLFVHSKQTLAFSANGIQLIS